MYTTGEIAAQLCLETPGLDTLDIAVFWGGSPTIASTQTILVNAALAEAYYLEQNQYVAVGSRGRPLPARHPRPARARARPALGRHLAPGLVQASDPRVANVKALGGVFNKRADARRAADRRRPRSRPTKDMDPDEQYAALTATAAQVMNQMPPRENPRAQQVARLGARLRPARPRALRHPRQPATTSRPGCCRRTPRTRCCSSRRSGSGSPRAARRSGTASCSACCAASAWCSEPVLTVEG